MAYIVVFVIIFTVGEIFLGSDKSVKELNRVLELVYTVLL